VKTLPKTSGTYCLIFKAGKVRFKTKGNKEFVIDEGTYLYVGSAFSPGGLEKRILRHLKKRKKKHWHLDYITTHDSFKLIEIWTIENKRVECELASVLSKMLKPVPNFGSTDCSCPSHLFKIENISSVLGKLSKIFEIKVWKF
jgi:Uri superfamily endonuclease